MHNVLYNILPVLVLHEPAFVSPHDEIWSRELILISPMLSLRPEGYLVIQFKLRARYDVLRG